LLSSRGKHRLGHVPRVVRGVHKGIGMGGARVGVYLVTVER
jgi:hypothetical protein